MKKCLIFLILVLSIVFWYSYASAYSDGDIEIIENNAPYLILDFDPISMGSYNYIQVCSDALGCSQNSYIITGNSDNVWLGLRSGGLGFFNLTYSNAEGDIPNGVYTYYVRDYSNNLLASNSFTVYNGSIQLPDVSSRIDSISVSTSTNTVNLTGYWNATTTSGVYEQLEFYQINSIFGQEDYYTINATTSGAFNINFDYRNVATPYVGTTTIPLTSNQIFYANLYEKNNAYYNPFGEYDFRYSTLIDATSTSLTASTTNTFNISTSTIVNYPEYECSISAITGCFKNALIWTFYPTQSTIARYYALVELIQKKAPVGYFTITKNAINGLSATSTLAFSITIPAHLKSYIFDPVDIGLASIFWVYLIFSFYKRLKHLQI
jgi:hypothetical protein